MMQAEVVQGNILSLIRERALQEYIPQRVEGALKLSLGLVSYSW
jgi:hypothetical protein